MPEENTNVNYMVKYSLEVLRWMSIMWLWMKRNIVFPFPLTSLTASILMVLRRTYPVFVMVGNLASVLMKLKVSWIIFVQFWIRQIGVGRMMCMASIKLLKKEVTNLKENLNSIESDDPQLNKLHSRVYSLKMSLLNVDTALSELNFLTKKDIQRSETLLILKDFYRKELRSLEMVLWMKPC